MSNVTTAVGCGRRPPFLGRAIDLVVLDHDTRDYVREFEVVRGTVVPNGVVVAENGFDVTVTDPVSEGITPSGLLDALGGDSPPNERTRSVTVSNRRVADDPEFEPYALPVCEGLFVSCRIA